MLEFVNILVHELINPDAFMSQNVANGNFFLCRGNVPEAYLICTMAKICLQPLKYICDFF